MAHIPNVNSSQSQDFKVSRVCDNPGSQSVVHLRMKLYSRISEKSRLVWTEICSRFNFICLTAMTNTFSSLNSSNVLICWTLVS